jgi:putative ABC transport system permease protein
VTAVRECFRHPLRIVPAVLTLAAGIAASSAVFTLADAVLFRPLPFSEPAQLAALSGVKHGKEPTAVSWQDVRDLNAHAASAVVAAAYLPRTWGFSDDTGQPLEVVLSVMVTERFYDVLRVPARWEKGAVWLAHPFWKARFQADPSIVGGTVALNDERYRVAGILPEWFRMPLAQGEPSVIIPLAEGDYCCQRDGRTLEGIVRFAAPGGTRQWDTVSRQFASAFPESNREFQFTTEALQTHWAGDRRKVLMLLMAAVGLLMLVAAANAAGLLLARAAANARNAAIRMGLGETFASLAADRICQGVWIGFAAGCLGFLGATWILAVARHAPSISEAIENYNAVPDWRAAMFSIATGLVTGVVSSLVPLAALRPMHLESLLRAGGQSASPSKAMARTRFALLAAQFAFTVVLLACGATLLIDLRTLISADGGFRTDRVVIAGIGIPETRYNTDEKLIAFHRDVIANLRRIPGVLEAGGGAAMPVGAMRSRVSIGGQPQRPVNERPRVAVAVASPEMFSILQIPILRGRGFDAGDRYGAPLKALVNEMFVAHFLAGRNPIGQTIQLGFYNGGMKAWMNYEIDGVTGNTLNRGIDRPGEPQVFLSSAQIPLEGFLYFARTERDAASLTGEFREAVWQVDRNIQAISPRPLAQYLERRLDQRKTVLYLLGAFAAFALAFAALGLAAGMAAATVESRKEFAIRAALGERPAELMMRVLRRGLQIAACGFIAGVAGAFGASRWISAILTDARPVEWLALIPVAVALTAAVLIACLGPALQAGRADPAHVLRQ